jgi:hypothetical protein
LSDARCVPLEICVSICLVFSFKHLDHLDRIWRTAMRKRLIRWVTLAVLAACAVFPAQAGNSDIGHSKAPIFSTAEKIVFTLKTDFADLWNHRAPANAEVPEDIEDFSAPGRLSWKDSSGEHDLPVQVQLRGNTSQAETECPFPKMTLSFEKDRATDDRVSKGTLFNGLHSVGIGTHCGGKQGASLRFRRVWGGLSPHREALVYKVQELLDIPGFQATPAKFSYIDSNTGKGPVEPQPSGFAVTQPMPGFFLENIKTFVKNAKGKEIRAADAPIKDSDKQYVFTSVADAKKDARDAGSEIEPIDPRDIIRILLFQSLIGNYDWKMRISRDDTVSRGLWNMKVIEADGKWIIFPYDYDLSGWVRPDDSTPKLPGLANPFFKPADVSAVVKEFRQKRPAMEALADDLAKEDKNGAGRIKSQIRSFYDALDRRFP